MKRQDWIVIITAVIFPIVGAIPIAFKFITGCDNLNSFLNAQGNKVLVEESSSFEGNADVSAGTLFSSVEELLSEDDNSSLNARLSSATEEIISSAPEHASPQNEDIGAIRTMYEHYISYIEAINTGNINAVQYVTTSYRGILKGYGLTGENMDYNFDFYEMRVNLDTLEHYIDHKTMLETVSFDANCLFKYRKKGNGNVWREGANMLLCHLVYDSSSQRWRVSATYEQKEHEDEVLGIDTDDGNLLILNEKSYREYFYE